MTKPVYIVDVFNDIVSGMTPDLLPILQQNETAAIGRTLINTIDYQYGHVKELMSKLANMDKSPQLKIIKYPLVYLVQDFPEDRGDRVGIYGDVMLNIVICHQTENTSTIEERMRKVFKPVLYPIYYALLEAIANYPLINVQDETMIKHRKIDRAYWGRLAIGGTDANVLNDYVDAIDVTNMKLPILYNC